MPYHQAEGGAPFNPKTQKRKSRMRLVVALTALGLLGVLAVVGVAVFVLKDRDAATDVKLGDCITEVPTASHVLTVPTIDCAQPHAGEVYAILQVPDGPFPGEQRIDEYKQRCPAEFTAFAGESATTESVTIFVLYPTTETWERGDRAVTCIATVDPKRSGSLKG